VVGIAPITCIVVLGEEDIGPEKRVSALKENRNILLDIRIGLCGAPLLPPYSVWNVIGGGANGLVLLLTSRVDDIGQRAGFEDGASIHRPRSSQVDFSRQVRFCIRGCLDCTRVDYV
jgi:hypothetical protein